MVLLELYIQFKHKYTRIYIIQVSMHVRLGDPIRIIQFTNYPFDRIL